MSYKFNPFTGKLDKVNDSSGSDHYMDQSFTPTNGQTEFILSSVPSSNAKVFMFINNATYIVGDDFTISGSTITWLGAFTIQSTDTVTVRYAT